MRKTIYKGWTIINDKFGIKYMGSNEVKGDFVLEGEGNFLKDIVLFDTKAEAEQYLKDMDWRRTECGEEWKVVPFEGNIQF